MGYHLSRKETTGNFDGEEDDPVAALQQAPPEKRNLIISGAEKISIDLNENTMQQAQTLLQGWASRLPSMPRHIITDDTGDENSNLPEPRVQGKESLLLNRSSIQKKASSVDQMSAIDRERSSSNSVQHVLEALIKKDISMFVPLFFSFYFICLCFEKKPKINN